MEDKLFRIFMRVYSLLKSKCLSANNTVTLQNIIPTFVVTYSETPHTLHPEASAKQGALHYWQFSKVHILPRNKYGFQSFVRV